MNTRRDFLRIFPLSVFGSAIGVAGRKADAFELSLVCDGAVKVAASASLPESALSEIREFGIILTRMVSLLDHELTGKSWRFDFELANVKSSASEANLADMMEDRFQIQVTDGLVSVQSKTGVGLVNAAWAIAKQFGYRQYFPGMSWEYVPRLDDLELTGLSDAVPDFSIRSIWHGYGTYPLVRNAFDEWCVRNRAVSSFVLETKHAFDRVILEFSDRFENDLELWAELEGVRVKDRQRKPCLGNPKVKALFTEYAFRHFKSRPLSNCVSFEPSDGGGWCKCSKWCQPIGGPSNQLVSIANHASRALSQAGYRKFVAFYAYNEHSVPPTLPVESRIIVSIATKFNKSKFTVEELIQGWDRMGAIVGIRDYLSVFKWDQDLPQSAVVSDIDSTLNSIRSYWLAGARIYSAEAGDNWGPCGLGYWSVAQCLWAIRSNSSADELVAEFCQQMFGRASHIMKGLYFNLLKSSVAVHQVVAVGQIAEALCSAWHIEPAPAVRQRVADLTFYAHYCRLYLRYRASSGLLRFEIAKELVIHVWYMRFTSMVHTKAIFSEIRRDIPGLFPLKTEVLKSDEQRKLRYTVTDALRYF